MLLLEVKAITDSNFTYVIGLSQQFLGGNGISPLHQNYPLIDRLAAKPSDFHAAILQTHSWRKSIKITNQQPTRRRRASVFPHAAKNEAQESVPIANQKVDTSPPAAQQDDSEPATTVQEPQDEDNTDTDDTNIDDEDSKDGVSKSEHEWKVDKKALGEPFQRFHLNELRKYASQKSSFFVDFCQQRGGAVNCPDRRVPTILKKKQLAVTKFGEAGLEGTAARTVIQKVEPLCKHEKRNYRPFNEEPAPKEWEGRTMSHRCSNCINRGNRNM